MVRRLTEGILGKRIFIYSLWLVLVVTLFSFIFQLFINFSARDKAQEEELESLLRALEPTIIQNLWQNNDLALNTLLSSLVLRPEVVYAAIHSDFLDLAKSQDEAKNKAPFPYTCSKLIERDFSEQTIAGQRLGSGRLEVCFVPKGFVPDELLSILFSFLPHLFGILIIAYGLLKVNRRLVIQPIVSLTKALGLSTPIEHYKFERPNSSQKDELDLLLQELKDRAREFRTEYEIRNAAFQGIVDAIAVTDHDFQIIRSNTALKKLFTHTCDVVGKEGTPQNIFELLPGLTVDHEQYGAAQSYKGKDERNFEVVVVQLKRIGYVFVIRDITEKLQLLEEAVAGQKMQAIGTLSSGIAHDFNNLLSIVSNNIELVLLNKTLSEPIKSQLESAYKSALNGVKLTDQLLNIARRHVYSEKQVDPSHVVQDIRQFSERFTGPNFTINVQNDSKSFVEVDQSHLETALLNLIINARDAMPDGGTIVVSVFDEQFNDRPFVVFCVKDSGVGINPKILNKVQAPFFTTKLDQSGTGLGLSMVSGFASRSGGKVDIESELGVGTTIRVFLPASKSDQCVCQHDTVPIFVEAPELEDKAQASDERKMRILIVEDVIEVAQTILAQVEHLGHKPDVVHSLSQLTQSNLALEEYDMVLCDVFLGDANGLSVWEYFEQNKCIPPFIFMSGNVSLEIADKIAEIEKARILSKPFSLSQLRQMIEKVIE